MSVKITNGRIEEAIGAFAKDVLTVRADKAITKAQETGISLLNKGQQALGINVSVMKEAMGKSLAFATIRDLRVTDRIDFPGQDYFDISPPWNYRNVVRELFKCDTSWQYDYLKMKLASDTMVFSSVIALLEDAIQYAQDPKEYLEDWGPKGCMLDDDDIPFVETRNEIVKQFVADNEDLVNEHITVMKSLGKIMDDMDKLVKATDKAVGQKRAKTSLEAAVPELMPYLQAILDRDNGVGQNACETEGSDLADLASCMRVKEDC